MDAGYVSLRRLGLDRWEIRGHKYVGQARSSDVELQIVEKQPGSLLSLIKAATGAELRIEAVDSPEGVFDVVSKRLMGVFADAAGRYIAERRVPRYAYRDAASPALSGSLDMASTIRLHATGRRTLFAYKQGFVVRDEPLDRLVLAGLCELDRAGPVLGLDAQTLYDARWFAGALEAVRDERFISTPTPDFLAIADALEQDQTTSDEDVDLARLAAVALLHQGFDPGQTGAGAVPRAWFVDLERLFEQAVRRTLGELLEDDDVDRGEQYERRMFSGLDTSRTNPDVVVHRDGRTRFVGDVKYKNLGEGAPGGGDASDEQTGKASRSDLYQLLVHTASLQAERAFLVYPGEYYACQHLGRSATGSETWTVQVRVLRLENDLRRFAAEVGLSSPLPATPRQPLA